MSEVKQAFLRGWFVLFFVATGTAALLGAIAHGFVADAESMRYRLLWIGIFGAIGVAAVASWIIGSQLAFSALLATWLRIIALASFIGYLGVVLFISQSFTVAVIYYLPAALFLFLVLVVAQIRSGGAPNMAAGGILLSFLAAYVQQAEISLGALSHNALYHVVQAIALFLIFLGSLQLVKAGPHGRQS